MVFIITFATAAAGRSADAEEMRKMEEKLKELLSRMEAEIAELKEIGEDEYAEGIEYALKLIRSQLF